MTDQEIISREQAKLDKQMLSRLRRIAKTGFAGREALEFLAINNLIHFSPPRDGFIYNHYRLTEAGKQKLAELSA